MIQDNFAYYTTNQEEIVKDHLGEFVVIKDSAVQGYYGDEANAFEAMKDNQLGTFSAKITIWSANRPRYGRFGTPGRLVHA